jgi:hypothetical protein
MYTKYLNNFESASWTSSVDLWCWTCVYTSNGRGSLSWVTRRVPHVEQKLLAPSGSSAFNPFILESVLLSSVFCFYSRWLLFVYVPFCSWPPVSLCVIIYDLQLSMHITTKVVSSNPVHGEMYSMQHYVITFVSDFQQVGGFLRILGFPSPVKLIVTI